MQISLEHEQPILEHTAHPSERELAAFMRGTASREEAMIVVLHLLTRCQTCVEVTMSLWWLGDRAPREKAAPKRRVQYERREGKQSCKETLGEERQRKP